MGSASAILWKNLFRRKEMNKIKSFGIRAAAGLLLASALCCNAGAQSASEMTGPYKVVMEMIPSLPNHTVYRPENLVAVKGKLPVVAFGNGGCANVGNAFQNYLSEVASHGFIIVANGPIDLDAPNRAVSIPLWRYSIFSLYYELCCYGETKEEK
jgi:hypothetical protein